MIDEQRTQERECRWVARHRLASWWYRRRGLIMERCPDCGCTRGVPLVRRRV